MGIELERHPPERGALPVIVAGGCCTTCCCCCCCCAYVVGGLAGAALGSASALSGGEGAKKAVGNYWKLVGWTFAASLIFGLLGFAVHGLWIISLGLLFLGVPAVQAVAALIMLLDRDPAARRAGVRVTLSWVAFTVLGVVATAMVFQACSDSASTGP